jgi:hypothetical protein
MPMSSAATKSVRAEIRCREIFADDIAGIVTLLHEGFPERDRAYWTSVLDRMTEHSTPHGFPKYGYLLQFDNRPVGIILVIFSSMAVNGRANIRGNVASWYVEPAFRGYATMLTSHALAHKNVTFLNISPARWTWPILEAQGYTQYCSGQFLALPAFAGGFFSARVKTVLPDISPADDLSPFETDLLLAHAKYGCISVTCTAAGRRHPFVFMRSWHRWKIGSLPYALLVYCRDLDDFIRFAGPLGRFLAWRGLPMAFINSNGSIPGLIGKPVDKGPKFVRGPHPPHLGDLAYTELVMFGS